MLQKLNIQNGIITRQTNALVYNSTAHIPLIELCNIFGSSKIRIRLMPTNLTFNKSPMPDSISVMTNTATLGGIGRININNSDSFSQCLIFNKTLELVESPLVNPFIVSGSCSDIFQIFHDDYIAIIQTFNNIFADIVVTPSHKPIPISREIFKFSLGSSGAFRLENRNKSIMLDSQLFDIFTIKFSFRCNSDFIDPEVNTQNPVTMLRFLDIFPEECESEIIFTFGLSEQTFSDFPIEIFQSIIRNFNRNFNSALNSGNTQDIIFETKTSRGIISDRNSIYNWIGFCFLNHPTGLFNTRNSQLRRQSNFSQILIDKRMELHIISNFHTPSNINTMLKSFFVKFNSFNYNFINFNLNWNTSQHSKDLTNSNYLNVSEADNSSPQQVEGSPCLKNL